MTKVIEVECIYSKSILWIPARGRLRYDGQTVQLINSGNDAIRLNSPAAQLSFGNGTLNGSTIYVLSDGVKSYALFPAVGSSVQVKNAKPIIFSLILLGGCLFLYLINFTFATIITLLCAPVAMRYLSMKKHGDTALVDQFLEQLSVKSNPALFVEYKKKVDTSAINIVLAIVAVTTIFIVPTLDGYEQNPVMSWLAGIFIIVFMFIALKHFSKAK